MSAGQILLREIGPCLDEALGIKRDTPVEPLCAGNGAHHEKDVSYVVGFGIPGLVVAPADLFEMMLALHSDDFAVGPQEDGGILFDAANQIARHGFRQSARSYEHMHTFAHLREENRRLAG